MDGDGDFYRSELNNAMLLISALVKRNGGQVQLTALELTEADIGNIMIYTDPVSSNLVISTLKRGIQ